MKIALFGYGKMGKEIEQIALQRKHEIVLKINKSNIKSLTREELKKCNTAIEFSTPQSAITNMTKCFDAGIPVVVGTTGWYDKVEEIKEKFSEEIPPDSDKKRCLFYASNFSIGVNIFFKLNEQLSKIMNDFADYNVSIEEIHHVHKLDAPSGTAITLANDILHHIKRKSSWKAVTEDKKQKSEAMEKYPDSSSPSISHSDLLITSKRIDDVPGTHTVKYHSTIDDIEIMHKAHNRRGFAMGAVLAAEFINGKNGIFGMNDLIQF